MDRCDVLIVGGGPAGSSCAWGLRSSGLDVRILDRQAFPRDKVCAGWVTPQVIEALEIDLDDYRGGHVCQPITGFRTGMLGGREVVNHYDQPVSYGIRRCEFDHYLLSRCGARLLPPGAAESIEREGDAWVINGSQRATVLVGAGGHFCPVARMLGAPGGESSPVVAAQEIEFEATPEQLTAGSIEASTPELFFCPDLAGYGWCFRKGNFLNIGLGRTDREQLSTHVRHFLEFLRSRGKVVGEVPDRFRGHAYRLYERNVPKLHDAGVILVGDSAGLAYPQSGEGIRPAVESGLLAAATLAAADGHYTRERLKAYAARIVERFGKPREGAASDLLPAGWLRFVAAQLMASRLFARRVVIERWFLHMHQPAFKG